MRKIIFILIIVLIFFVGTTYSKEDVKDGEYLIKVSNITNKNINLLDTCTYKIITIYPDNTYNIMKSYIYNNDIDSFEKMYLKKIEKISTSEYYNMKLKGIKIDYIKVYSSSKLLKKCNNYLEKVEPL